MHITLLRMHITLLRMRMRIINLKKLFKISGESNWPKNWIYILSSRSPKRKKNHKIFS